MHFALHFFNFVSKINFTLVLLAYRTTDHRIVSYTGIYGILDTFCAFHTVPSDPNALLPFKISLLLIQDIRTFPLSSIL